MSRRTLYWLQTAIAGCLLAPLDTYGQTWLSNTGNWSDPTQWSASPVPTNATALMFPIVGSGSLAYVSTNDLPGAFTLNQLWITGSPVGSLTLSSSGLGGLRFAGPTPMIASGASGDAFVTTRVAVAGANPLAIVPAAGGTIRFLQPIDAPGLTLGLAAGGTVALAAHNRVRGNVAVTQTSLNLSSVDSLGNAALQVNDATLSLGTFTFATAPNRAPYLPNDITVTAGNLTLGDGKSFTLAGNITGAGGVAIAPSSLSIGTWTLAGNNSFTGAITVNSAPGSLPGLYNMIAVTAPIGLGAASQINLFGGGAAVGFVGATSAYTVSKPINLNNGGAIGVFDDGGRADVTLDNPIAGTGGLTRIGNGVLTLSGNNTFTSGLIHNAGYTFAVTDAALGAAGQSITLGGGTLSIGPAVTTLARNIALSTTTGGTLYTDGSINLTGTLSNAGSTPGGFAKAGTGTLRIGSTAASVGSVVIDRGTIVVGGTSGQLLTTGTIAVNQGGALVLDYANSTAAKLSNNVPVALRGATLRVTGNAGVNTAVTSTGALTLGSTSSSGQGLTAVALEPTSTRHTLLRFASLGRTANNGVHVLFSGANLGVSTISSAVAGQSNVQFTTAPTLVNGILPYALIDRGAGLDLASYSANNGIIPATYNSNSINVGSVATNNVQVGGDTIAAAGTINSAKFTGGTVDLSAGTLTIGSGAMLFTGPTTITGGTLVIGTGTLNSNQAPTANFFTFADTTIASRLIVNTNTGAGNDAGIAKSGPGVLTLSNTASIWQGPTRILQGTFRMGASNIIGNNSLVLLNSGAAIDMNGFSDTWGSVGDPIAVDPVLPYTAGTIAVGTGTLSIGADNDSSTSHLNFTGSGTLIKSGTGRFTSVGEQAFDGRVIVAGGTLALGTHRLTGTGFDNAASIALGQTGSNADVGLRLEEGLIDYNRPIGVSAVAGRTAVIAFADGVAGTLSSPITLLNAQGVTIDAAGGAHVAGTIASSGGTFPMRVVSTGVGTVDSRRYSIRFTGNNSSLGTVTLAANATVASTPTSLGGGATTLRLGSDAGADNPELSFDTGLTFPKPIVIPGSTSAAARFAILGSRAPTGAGTATLSQSITSAGSRSRLILFSNGEPLHVAGTMNLGAGSLQIGHSFSADDNTTRGTVILGAASFTGGTTLAAGTLALASPLSLGSGSLTIGSPTIAIGHEPALAAANPLGGSTALATINQPVLVRRNFRIATLAGVSASTVQFNNTIDLGDTPRIITIDSMATVEAASPTGFASGPTGGLVKAGAGRLNLYQTTPLAGALVADAGVTAIRSRLDVSGLTHVGPTARLHIDDGFGAALKTSALTIDVANNAQLDLQRAHVVVDYATTSPLQALTAAIAAGRNGGSWDGPGIRSSMAEGNPMTAVGIVEASDLGASSFLGTSFAGDAVLMRYTLAADSNLDGAVNLDDFTALAVNFGFDGQWFNGDFDYSGNVDLDDFTTLANTFGQPLPASVARQSVPEPTLLAPAVVLALVGRRRRNHCSQLLRSNP